MDKVDRLLAIEEIKQLKARYQRALDTGDWDVLEACLTEDFTVVEDILPEGLSPRDAVMDAIRMGFEAFAANGGWKHWVILPEIEITSETTATGVWTYLMENRGPSRYEDRYAKVDGAWRLQWTRVHAGARVDGVERPAAFTEAKERWEAAGGSVAVDD